MKSGRRRRSKCPFPKCRRLAEHDGDHSVAPPQNRRKTGGKKLFGNGIDPSVGKATQIQPGERRNPGGRPKYDLASELAQAIFEENIQAIKAAYLKLLKRGSLGAFALLAERAYGKIAQPIVGGGEGEPPIVVKIDC
jgi:hypothetical protein